MQEHCPSIIKRVRRLKMTTNGMRGSGAVCVPNGYAQKPKEVEGRGHWGTKAEFILTVMGAIIGPGNIWRFPYLCYKNGGGVFFIPYILFMFTCGIPLFFLETALGQYTSQGGITCWRQICPLFQVGLGEAGVYLQWSKGRRQGTPWTGRQSIAGKQRHTTMHTLSHI
ncbi:hypothetical protein ILYODFUR_030157 [Ilyodon furcidens]|uniref:Transporter n=1 Tax=Ilyodon furcidens TaxID=33524 RepID=A0ABV0T1P1_9TELE